MDDLSGSGETDEREAMDRARETVREMIKSGRPRLNGQVAVVLKIIDQPDYPKGVANQLHAMIAEIATMIRHQYLMEGGKTSGARSTLLKCVSADERRVLEAAYARQQAKSTKNRPRRTAK